MPERIILLGLACTAFVVTLGVSSWREGLWHSGGSQTAQDIENVRRTRSLLSATVPATQPAHPFAPAVVAPEVVATAAAAPSPPPATVESTPLSAPAPELTQSQAQSEPSTSPEVDNGEMLDRMDRAARRGARSH